MKKASKKNFTKLTRKNGISLIVLVITIIVILILAAAVIITLNNNNPIAEANKARYESDRANMQAVFTNTVAKVMTQNRATISVTAGQINNTVTGVKETTGEVNYTVTNAMNSANSSGTIYFDKGDNDETKYYTGKKLPIYGAGETKWYVDSEGNISLEVAEVKYGSGEIKKPVEVTLITGTEFNALIPRSIKSIEFLNTAAPTDVETMDISEIQDGSVLAWVDGTVFYVAPKNSGDIICANPDSSNMFNFGVDTGDDFQPGIRFESIKLDNFNTSNVVDMSYMFRAIRGQDGFSMDLSSWNTSKVEDMSYMFNYAYLDENTFNISNWDVSSVKNMNQMFSWANLGTSATSVFDLSNWNVSNVTTVNKMFYHASGRNLDLSNWNLSKITNLANMFEAFDDFVGIEIKLNLTNWNVSNVTNMNRMFLFAGDSCKSNFIIEGLNTWDVSNVTDISNMFYNAGKLATETWNIGDISGWTTSNIENMDDTFRNAGYAADYSMDLSGWNVSKVTSHERFNNGVESKIISPWD